MKEQVCKLGMSWSLLKLEGEMCMEVHYATLSTIVNVTLLSTKLVWGWVAEDPGI